MLRQKWVAMKSALAARQVGTAAGYFVESSQQLYTDIFNELYNELPGIVEEMTLAGIQLVSVKDNMAKFRITRNEVHSGQTYPISYYIYFVVDEDGLWKLYKF